MPPARKLVFSLQLSVAQCCVLRYRGMKCNNWTAHVPIAIQRSTIFFLFFFFFVSASSRLCLSYVSATPRLRLTYALASISCEHCRSSRNNPHCAPRHVIYYFQRPDFWHDTILQGHVILGEFINFIDFIFLYVNVQNKKNSNLFQNLY